MTRRGFSPHIRDSACIVESCAGLGFRPKTLEIVAVKYSKVIESINSRMCILRGDRVGLGGQGR